YPNFVYPERGVRAVCERQVEGPAVALPLRVLFHPNQEPAISTKPAHACFASSPNSSFWRGKLGTVSGYISQNRCQITRAAFHRQPITATRQCSPNQSCSVERPRITATLPAMRTRPHDRQA